MIGRIKKRLNKENGAVEIVEATFVFPIMFIILCLLIYVGNMHFIKAQIESIVVQNAIRGASHCADPMLETIRTKGAIPAVKDVSAKPYRYIGGLFGGMDTVESSISQKVMRELKNTGTLFGNMAPVIKTKQSEIAKYNSNLLFSTFSVGVKYEVKFPIRIFGERATVLKVNAFAEMPVSDASEFIRNTDMVIDYFSDTGLGKSISGAFEKINEFLQKFGGA